MQWMMLQQNQTEDFVIATGVQYSVRVFIQWRVEELGIKLKSEENDIEEHVIVKKIDGNKAPTVNVGQIIIRPDERYFFPTEVEKLLGDSFKTKSKLGCTPEITGQKMCSEMVSADFDAGKRLTLLQANGFVVNLSLQ